MSAPLVVVDADVLGRRRTGDETYVRNLLRELAPLAPAAGLRIGAVTRHPDLVPEGIEPVELRSRSQELRMAFTLPRLLRSVGAALVHTQYAVPLRSPSPCGAMPRGWSRRPAFRSAEGPPSSNSAIARAN